MKHLKPELIALFRCPMTHQPMTLADSNFVVRFNKSVDAGHVLDSKGQTVEERVDGLLVREDGEIGYCVRDEIAELTADAALKLNQVRPA